MTETQEKLVKAIMREMKSRGMDSDGLTEKAPYGFWAAVGKALDKSANTCQTAFNRKGERQIFIEYIHSYWNDPSDNIINPDISNKGEPTIEPANSITPDISDKPEPAPDSSLNNITDDNTDNIEGESDIITGDIGDKEDALLNSINPDMTDKVGSADNPPDNYVTPDMSDIGEDNHNAQPNLVTDDMNDNIETTEEPSNIITTDEPDKVEVGRNAHVNIITHDNPDILEPDLNPLINSVTPDNTDTIGRKEVERMISDLETRLSDMIKLTYDKADRLESRTPFDKANRPPDPPKTGKTNKKLAGEKRDIRTRIDKVLFDLVELDAVAHFNGNWSKALDAILWRYYGRPKLSFEGEE